MNNEELNTFEELVNNGEKALENKKYIDAWDNFYSAFKTKKEYFKSKRISEKNINDQDYAKVCYFLAQVIKEIKPDSDLLSKLMDEDEDLIKNKYKGSKARKFLGRKYLKMAADKDYPAAIVEYALNCIGYAPQGKLDYEYNRNNLDTAVYWANNIMKKHINKYVSAMGYCINAIYCLDNYIQSKDSKELENFADNILEADKINEGKFEQYITYHLGYLHAFPELETYKNGEYHDFSKGYKAFCEVVELGSDAYLIRNAQKLKESIEKYHPECL